MLNLLFILNIRRDKAWLDVLQVLALYYKIQEDLQYASIEQ